MIFEELVGHAKEQRKDSTSSSSSSSSPKSLLDLENHSAETPRLLAKKRPGKGLAAAMRRETLARQVPGQAVGFFAPWCQICSGFSLVTFLGWFFGCVAFSLACTGFGLASSSTRETERHVQHGFASGSIFFIVASFFVWLLPTVSTPFLAWYCLSVGLLVYFFVKTTTSDPGYVQLPAVPPKADGDDDPEASRLSTPLLADDATCQPCAPGDEGGSGSGGGGEGGERGSSGSAAMHIRFLARKGDLHASLLCSTCLLERPARSKHCGTCGRCVHRFDHHCPFVNTCVGRDNIGYFIGFTSFCTLAIGSHLYVALPHIWGLCGASGGGDGGGVGRAARNMGDDDHQGGRGGMLAGVAHGIEKLSCGVGEAPNALVVITGLAVVHFLWITFLGIAQMTQIYGDITTYEAIRGVESSPVNCKQGCANISSILRARPTQGTGPKTNHGDGGGAATGHFKG